jgi:tetratricopeptide (TPR) repeat protein
VSGTIVPAGRRGVAALLFAVAIWPAVSPSAHAADAFYEDLLIEGGTALSRGLHSEAVELLRTACFGLLEEPPRLAGCLVELGLAQAALGDVAGIRETFDRIGQIEERFGAYRQAPIPEEQRAAFETELARHVPRNQLVRVPLLQERARDAAADQIAALPPRERRKALEGRLRTNSQDAMALSLMVELELELGRERRAVESADLLIAAAPGSTEAHCTRGRALAADSRCQEAVPELESCARETMGPGLARITLTCLARLERWSEAEALLSELEPAILEAPAIQPLAEQIAAALAPPVDPAAEEALDAGTPEDTPAPRQADPEIAMVPPPAAEPPQPTPRSEPAPGSVTAAPNHPAAAELEQLRTAVDAIKTREELDALHDSVALFANQHPDYPEAQFVAGRVAYLGKRWEEAAAFFGRGGRPGPERAELLFYMAVASFESGNRAAARDLLESALPRLEKTAFVRGYVEKILPPTP